MSKSTESGSHKLFWLAGALFAIPCGVCGEVFRQCDARMILMGGRASLGSGAEIATSYRESVVESQRKPSRPQEPAGGSCPALSVYRQ